MKISRRHTRILADIRDRATRAQVMAEGNDFTAITVDPKAPWAQFDNVKSAQIESVGDGEWLMTVHGGLYFKLFADTKETAPVPDPAADPIPETSPDIDSGERVTTVAVQESLHATLIYAVRHDLTGTTPVHTHADPEQAWAAVASGAQLYEFPDPLYRVVESALLWFTLSESPLVLDDGELLWEGRRPTVEELAGFAEIAESRRQANVGVGHVGDNPTLVVFDEASEVLAGERSTPALLPAADRTAVPDTSGTRIRTTDLPALVRFHMTTSAVRHHRLADDSVIHVAIDPDVLHAVFTRGNDEVWHVFEHPGGAFTMIPVPTSGVAIEDVPIWYTLTTGTVEVPDGVVSVAYGEIVDADGYTDGEKTDPPLTYGESWQLAYGFAVGVLRAAPDGPGVTVEQRDDCKAFAHALAHRHDRQMVEAQTPVLVAYAQWRATGEIQP